MQFSHASWSSSQSKALKEARQIHHLEQGEDNRKAICVTDISLLIRVNGKYLLQIMGEYLVNLVTSQVS